MPYRHIDNRSPLIGEYPYIPLGIMGNGNQSSSKTAITGIYRDMGFFDVRHFATIVSI